MSNKNKNEHGPFAKLFAIVGLIAGAIFGLEAAGGGGMLFGAVLLAAIGGWIGQLADAILARLIFIIVSLALIMVNAGIRSAIWQLINS